MMLTNIISGISAILATKLLAKIGAIQIMVMTHVNYQIEQKKSLKFHCFCLIDIHSIKYSSINNFINANKMFSCYYVFTLIFNESDGWSSYRQTFLTICVENDEHSAAGAIKNLVRSIGFSIPPIIVGYL